MAEARRDNSQVTLLLDGARLLCVEARFYEEIGAMLLAGAERAAAKAGASLEVITVAGALEIPIMMKIALEAATSAGVPYDGAVALGCVIRGQTYHFEIVADQSARALMDLGLARNLALGNSILTMDTMEQAHLRADPERGDKGGEAVRAALGLAAHKRRLGVK